jgi:hypothetical protein
MAEIWADGDDFDAMLMSKAARILDDGHFAVKGADIRATDANGAVGG